MSFGFEHVNVRHHPAFGYFAGLPLGTDMAYETFAGWIADGGAELWDDISARFNVKSLLAGHTGRSPGLWTSELVHSLNDLAGKRIQTQGLTCDVVRGIGGEPCDAANGDAVAALSAGTLDAIELGSLAHGVASGISRDAKFCMAGGLTTSGSVLSVTFRRDVWHGLGAELKSVVKIVAAAEARRSIAEADANQDILQRALTEGHGVSFYDAPRDLVHAATRVAQAVIADVAARDAVSRRINADYLRIRKPRDTADLS